MQVMRVGMQVRSSLTLAIFHKSVMLSPSGKRGRSTGRIVTLVSSDCETLQTFCQSLHVLWSSPGRIVISVILLYQQLGPSAFVALGLLALLLPVQKVRLFVSRPHVHSSRVMSAAEDVGGRRGRQGEPPAVDKGN